MLTLLAASILSSAQQIKLDFPIAVWLQDPAQASRYVQAGFNLYVGLWQGPTEEQLDRLKHAGMPVICDQNAVGLAHLNDPFIYGWMHGDEPDNAQEVTDPKTGKRGYGPPIRPEKIVEEYQAMKAKDPSRPIMLNLGQGVANDQWIGRGSDASIDDYPKYVKGADIVSFDVYPVAGLGPKGADLLWYVPKGIDRLKKWTEGKQSVWNCIECTNIGGEGKPTPAQVRAEVWMSIIHGSKGLIYFVHQFKPSFDEHALLDDPAMLAAVTKINVQIHGMAATLTSPTLIDGVKVDSPKDAPVDAMLKKGSNGGLFLYSVGMRNAPSTATFTVKGLATEARAIVIGEGREISVVNGKFTDSFDPYGVHMYRIDPR